MPDQWFIRRGGREDGPYDPDHILDLYADEDDVSVESPVRRDGETDWVPLNSTPWFQKTANTWMDRRLKDLGLCLSTTDTKRFLQLAEEFQAARNGLVSRWGERDLRTTTFYRCASILRSAYVGHAHLLVNLVTGAFWEGTAVDLEADASMIAHTCREFETFLVIGTDQLFFSAIEDSFRQLVTAIDPTACGGPAGEFKNVYGWLLKRLNLRQWEPLLDLLRMTRNVIHNNGRYVDTRGVDRTVVHGGTSYAFEHMKHIGFVHWHFFADRFTEAHAMLKEVYDAPEVERLGPVTCHSTTAPK
jgi:hypothetical protein